MPVIQPGKELAEEFGVATPLSASYADTINRMVEQLANKTGKFVTGGGHAELARSPGLATTRDRLANVVAGYLKMFAPDPADTASYIPMGGVVTNAAHPTARLAKRFHPKMYREIARESNPMKYTFADAPPTAKYQGALTRNPSEGTATIEIQPWAREVLQDIADNPGNIEFWVQNDPKSLYEALTVLPHELGHAVRTKIASWSSEGKKLVDDWVRMEFRRGSNRPHLYQQGMPTEKGARVGNEFLMKNRGVGEQLDRALKGEKSTARISPVVKKWAKKGYQDDVTRADEALIQQAAQNQARNAGIVPRYAWQRIQEFMDRRYK